jgi:prepilin peptidase CpaA
LAKNNMGPSPEVVTSAAVIASSVAAAAIDLRTRRVPNALTAATAAAGLAIAVTGVGSTGVIASIVGGLVGFALLLPGHIWGGTGGGDVKLLAALGTLLGPNKIIVAFLATAISGGLIALVIALLHRRFRNETFAYAPAIAVGAIVALWR